MSERERALYDEREGVKEDSRLLQLLSLHVI